MNNGKYVFAQITDFLPQRVFDHLINKYQGNKNFWGHTQNAVKIQVYCAIIAYCTISIIAKDLKIDRSIYEILQILGISLLDKHL